MMYYCIFSTCFCIGLLCFAIESLCDKAKSNNEIMKLEIERDNLRKANIKLSYGLLNKELKDLLKK